MEKRKCVRRTPKEFAMILNEKGFIPLEEARRMNDKILMQCKKCGHVMPKRIHSVIDRDYGCAKCSGRLPIDTETFREILRRDAPGYELLSEVEYGYKKCKIRCDKGHEYEVKPSNFINSGYRCQKCFFERYRGEGHPNYRSDLTKAERESNRDIHGYSTWQIEVKKRDNFVCQCCGDKRGRNLVSHHLDGWDNFRDKRLDVDNGVTLCEDCHKDFHGKYGYGGNTKKQYDEWVASAENSRRFLYVKKEAI